LSAEHRQQFEHARDRYRSSLALRIRRQYPAVSGREATSISVDIEAALVGYFEAGGLALASTLFTPRRLGRPIPSSILRFITDASARYKELLKRQAFVDASVGCFARPDAADRDYLGRISQGFAGFHMLGAFGPVAEQKLMHAKESAWLIDSSAQIYALAVAGPTYAAFAGSIVALRKLGVRLFTTESLFDETREHLWFANRVIKEFGVDSPEVFSAALGRLPYRKSNSFLEGFIGWRAAGNPSDWGTYLSRIFGVPKPDLDTQRRTLTQLGIEVVDFQNWPGFTVAHFVEREESADKICKLLDLDVRSGRVKAEDCPSYSKAKPEAEALVAVRRERDGGFNITRDSPGPKDSWFVSATSALNLLDPGETRLTWQPEAFVQFASTLAPVPAREAAEKAFEVLLLNVARSGLTLLDERIVENVFGGIIEQATLSLADQKEDYRVILSARYGEDPEAVLGRLRPSDRPLAALQLANQVAASRDVAARAAEAQVVEERRRANAAERDLKDLAKYRSKMVKSQTKGRAKAKKQKEEARNKPKGGRGR
jgi:hypothetical protein